MTLENIALCDNGNIELCDNGNIAFCQVPAPCSCPCTSWPPSSWPCVGLVEEYTLLSTSEYTQHFSGLKSEPIHYRIFVQENIVLSADATACRWTGTGSIRRIRYYPDGTVRSDVTQDYSPTIRLSRDDGTGCGCHWRIFLLGSTTSIGLLTSQTGNTPAQIYNDWCESGDGVYGPVTITEAT